MYAMTWTPLGSTPPALGDRSCLGCAFGADPVFEPATPKDVVLTTIMALVQKYFPQANEAMAQAFAEEIKPELPRLVWQMAAPIAVAMMLAVGVLWFATRAPAPPSRPRKKRRR